MNLRSLGALARAMNLPLSLWITRNRARLGQQENPVKTINLLHEQFSWPFPTGEKVRIVPPDVKLFGHFGLEFNEMLTL